VDTTYLLCYSVGMGNVGTMTNKFRLNWFIGIGMILAALFFSSFATVALASGKFSVPLMFVGMALNGFCQSTGWPGMMATMGHWFGKGKRGLLLAFWSVNANIGNILGSVVCSNLK
jgi:sugar phosphate permease